MSYSVAMLVAAALIVSACAEPPADDAADPTVEREASAVDGANPGADAPSPGDRADADEGADGGDDASDRTGDEVATTIPSRFHGEWNADRAACGSGQSETRLRISADRIRFYESVGVVREVDIESDGVITVTARYQGEGDTWEDERRLTLSQDGASLSVSGGLDIVRHRCP